MYTTIWYYFRPSIFLWGLCCTIYLLYLFMILWIYLGGHVLRSKKCATWWVNGMEIMGEVEVKIPIWGAADVNIRHFLADVSISAGLILPKYYPILE